MIPIIYLEVELRMCICVGQIEEEQLRAIVVVFRRLNRPVVEALNVSCANGNEQTLPSPM